MNKNLTVNMGNCNHRRYIPELVTMTRAGAVDPSNVLTRHCCIRGYRVEAATLLA